MNGKENTTGGKSSENQYQSGHFYQPASSGYPQNESIFANTEANMNGDSELKAVAPPPPHIHIDMTRNTVDNNKDNPFDKLNKTKTKIQSTIETAHDNMVDRVFHEMDEQSEGFSFVDLIAAWKNCNLLFCSPRRFINYRWANSVREHVAQGQNFDRRQFYKLYERLRPKYKYHPLQRWENAVRCFNVNKALEEHMNTMGTKIFYNVVCERDINVNKTSFNPDFTPLESLSSVHASKALAYQEAIRSGKSEEAAKLAEECYARGYSRVINAFDYHDWEKFREELRDTKHMGANDSYLDDHGVLPIAISYKGKQVTVTRRMNLVDDEGKPLDTEGIQFQEKEDLTSDFVDDFRWSQLIRSCRQIALERGVSRVRVWIDRLVMYEFEPEEKGRRYSIVDWEDYGLLAYAVCPVVRLYEANEKLYNTDFWRKLETVMGVAGHGLYVDDYMMFRYDLEFFYGYTMYKHSGGGIARIGGKGVYLRSVSLALATAIVTDAITVSGKNEHVKTKRYFPKWKAWALRTIGEGAYSSSHSALMHPEVPFNVGLEQFRTIAFWESYSSTCSWLSGESYLDMSIQKSATYSKGGTWNGVIEWLGNIESACKVENGADLYIKSFITENLKFSAWTCTPGHVAVLLELTAKDSRGTKVDVKAKKVKRTLAVQLTRHDSSRKGHVTAVADATGIWKTKDGNPKKILPWWLSHDPDPDTDQPYDDDQKEIVYEPMNVVLGCSNKIWLGLVMLITGCFIVGIIFSRAIFLLIPFILLYYLFKALLEWGGFFCCWPWPWKDLHYYGEGVFDNLLMHGLFDSQIKENQYRRLETIRYNELEWV